MLTNMSGKARAIKRRKAILWPARSANAATMRFALAPTKEPLPPRQAPSASDHHNGPRFSLPPKVGAIDSMIGIMVATKGILSTMADATADTQRISMAV